MRNMTKMLIYTIYLMISLVFGVDSIRVKVEQGWLEGSQLELVTGDGHYFSFKGVPYAAPPLGELRFKAPQPPLPWKGIRNASEHGPICVQIDIFTNKPVNQSLSSEDCLFLNVYTPDLNPKTPLPVMFYIHGGGYKSGSGNVDDYGPDFLVQRGVVLVTINYRLEVLGFLSLDTEEVPGNAGMKDQATALKWVKKNIAKFGGDPDNVTVFGQSAGGASTILHMASPMSRTLFKRAISMSGVPSCDWSLSYQPRRRAFVLGKQLGLDTCDPKKLLQFLQSIPAEKLAGVSPNVLAVEQFSGNVFKMYHFTPVIEKDFNQEQFLTEDPENFLRKWEINQKEVMIGHTSEEGIIDLVTLEDSIFKTYSQYAELLVPQKMLIMSPPDTILEISDIIYKHYFGSKPISKDTAREFLNYFNDATFAYDIHRYVNILSWASKRNVYLYKFSGVSERNIYGNLGSKLNLTGASHLDDTAYVFDPKRAHLAIDKNSREYKIIQLITKLFTDFAKFGNPTPDSTKTNWPAYSNSTKNYMDIGDTLVLGKGLDASAVAFWETIYKMVPL